MPPDAPLQLASTVKNEYYTMKLIRIQFVHITSLRTNSTRARQGKLHMYGLLKIVHTSTLQRKNNYGLAQKY